MNRIRNRMNQIFFCQHFGLWGMTWRVCSTCVSVSCVHCMLWRLFIVQGQSETHIYILMAFPLYNDRVALGFLRLMIFRRPYRFSFHRSLTKQLRTTALFSQSILLTVLPPLSTSHPSLLPSLYTVLLSTDEHTFDSYDRRHMGDTAREFLPPAACL